MPYEFKCQMCDTVISAETMADTVEQIKTHGARAHDIEKMSKDELDKRKKMIKKV